MDETASPWEAWSAVPDDVKSEVGRLARQGRRHPDERVAQAARDWAEALLGGEQRRHRWRWARNALLPLWWVANLALGGDDPVDAAIERRWARRILAAR